MAQYPELYILRHGQTTWNAEDRMQGALNSPLTELGQTQAARQYEILRSRDLSGFACWCSSQGRAFQTAAIALGPLVMDIRTDDRLREITVGDWSGKLRSELPKVEGDDPMIAQYDRAPNGEGLARLRDRCQAFLDDLAGPAVLVTHGITSRMIRSIAATQTPLPPAQVGGGQGCVFHVKDGVQNLLE